jgi:4-hydroxybenzoate polyprenyltransferase
MATAYRVDMATTRDVARLYRVRDWLHFLPLPLAGWMGGARNPVALAAGICAWACALAFASAINQAFDDGLDRTDVDKNPVGQVISRATALRWAILPLLLCVIFETLCPTSSRVVAALQLFAAAIYSAPPRIKRVPVLGTAWNLVVGLPGLLFADVPQSPSLTLRLLLVLFGLQLLVNQLLHETQDIEDDRRGGVQTIAALLGPRGAILGACFLLVASPLAAFWMTPVAVRVPMTAANTVFAVAWVLVLVSRRLVDEPGVMRVLRRQHRYTAFVYGAAVFALSIL